MRETIHGSIGDINPCLKNWNSVTFLHQPWQWLYCALEHWPHQFKICSIHFHCNHQPHLVIGWMLLTCHWIIALPYLFLALNFLIRLTVTCELCFIQRESAVMRKQLWTWGLFKLYVSVPLCNVLTRLNYFALTTEHVFCILRCWIQSILYSP